MGIGRTWPIIALIALSGCTRDVEASDPPTTAQEYRLIESDIADIPPADTKAEEERPAMRSPVEYD